MLDLDAKKLLKELAFLGAHSGLIFHARRIFSALGEENDEACALGMAFTHIGVGEFETAHEKLQQLIDVNPENWEALAFNCLAYILEEKQSEALVAAKTVISNAPDSSAAMMVKDLAAASSLPLNA
ncbi:tetratricopeptide repeat protein [Halodesulfovibrio marinisediminis]|uniref:hypothetical protein n=1 Tax=Halodesulfovibrio marinisediminis TaxID=458711 RepID=UPI00094161EC|nr:hypothetical protein [Halodesulfovibrio marinisediminis]